MNTLTKYIVEVNRKVPTEKAYQMASVIVEEARESHVDVNLVIGIIQAESTFKANARSSEGAVGLMQVHKKSHKDKKVVGIRNNVKSGISILKDNMDDCKTIKGALKRYSGGCSKYAKKVLNYRNQYIQFKQKG